MDKVEQNAEAEEAPVPAPTEVKHGKPLPSGAVKPQEPTEEPAAVEETAKAEESTKAEKSDELKIVLILNPGKVMLGVQSTDCDPVYTTFEGTLPTALKRIPKFVAEAKQKWSESPRYPDANLPTPEPTPVTARTAAAPKEKPKQPSFF